MSNKLPEGYRIFYGVIIDGTGYGDEVFGYSLQVYGPIKYRKWFKSYTYLGWSTIERIRWSRTQDQLIQTAHLHAKANKNE